MKWNSSSATWIGAAIMAVLAGGAAVDAGAAVKAKQETANGNTGASNDPWSGYGNGGGGNAASAYSGVNFYPQYPSLDGGGPTGGYGGGPCCNGVWDGYCAEKRQWCECRVKHRSRPLGRGAGPCCPNGCGQSACSPAAPVCHAAPCKRWQGLFHRCRKPCAPCAAGAYGVVEDSAAPVESAAPAEGPALEPVPDEQK
ncbi:MAG TPA: hypothetical protein VND64_35710 [Pirellulales bacterium]|nr:hypothetical protein [Pirellulales bacterium]